MRGEKLFGSFQEEQPTHRYCQFADEQLSWVPNPSHAYLFSHHADAERLREFFQTLSYTLLGPAGRVDPRFVQLGPRIGQNGPKWGVWAADNSWR